MFRTALLQSRHAARTAGANAVRPGGASSATATRPSIEAEKWVEADVNVPAGAVEFSEPLTVEELEASRDQIVAHLNQSWAGSEDDVGANPDAQMETLHVQANAVFQRTEPRNLLNTALGMASVPSVQHACMDAIRNDPTVYAAFSKLCEQHDMTLHVNGAGAPLALPASVGDPVSHPTSVEEPVEAGPAPLRAVLDAVTGALGAVGHELTAYIDRLQTRLHRLVLRLRGVDPDGPGDDPDSKGTAGPPAVEPGHMLMDVTVTATSLLVLVALLMRNGPLIAAVMRR